MESPVQHFGIYSGMYPLARKVARRHKVYSLWIAGGRRGINFSSVSATYSLRAAANVGTDV